MENESGAFHLLKYKPVYALDGDVTLVHGGNTAKGLKTSPIKKLMSLKLAWYGGTRFLLMSKVFNYGCK